MKVLNVWFVSSGSRWGASCFVPRCLWSNLFEVNLNQLLYVYGEKPSLFCRVFLHRYFDRFFAIIQDYIHCIRLCWNSTTKTYFEFWSVLACNILHMFESLRRFFWQIVLSCLFHELMKFLSAFCGTSSPESSCMPFLYAVVFYLITAMEQWLCIKCYDAWSASSFLHFLISNNLRNGRGCLNFLNIQLMAIWCSFSMTWS